MPDIRGTSAEELLRFTQLALDRLPDAAYWVEESSAITYVNDAACRMLGYTKAELLEKRIYELNPDLPPPSLASSVTRSCWDTPILWRSNGAWSTTSSSR